MTTKAEILRTIRNKCLDCTCNQPREIKLCTVYMCALYPYRFGVDPDPSQGRGFAKSGFYTGLNQRREGK